MGKIYYRIMVGNSNKTQRNASRINWKDTASFLCVMCFKTWEHIA